MLHVINVSRYQTINASQFTIQTRNLKSCLAQVNDRHAGTQYKFVFELLDLIDVPVVLVATKCDKGRSRHFDEMMYLAKVQKVPIVETSAIEDVNVAQAFFSLVRIFNRQVSQSYRPNTDINC